MQHRAQPTSDSVARDARQASDPVTKEDLGWMCLNVVKVPESRGQEELANQSSPDSSRALGLLLAKTTARGW